MQPTVRTCRLAGLAYLLVIVCGIGAEVALRGPLVDLGDAAGTAEAIRGAVATFRLAVAADAVMAVADVGLAVLLFVIFRPVAPTLALAAMVFRLVQSAVLAANLLNLQAAWLLLAPGGHGAGLAPGAAEATALLFLDLHAHGYDLGLVFFAVNSLATGALVVLSGAFPRVLGAALAAAGLVYLAGSAVRFLGPGLADAFAPAYLLPVVAETAFCVALLLGRGASPGRAGEPAARPAAVRATRRDPR